MTKNANGNVIEVFVAFLKLGLTSFGGPIAHLGYFRHQLVQQKSWLSEKDYAQLVALCQFLPGPASSQVGFGLGIMLAGFRGGLAAWVGFTLPSALLLILFASFLDQFTGPVADGSLEGLKLTALVMVAHAVWGMSQQLTPDKTRASLAVVALASALLITGVLGQMLALGLGIVVGYFLFTQKAKSEPGAQLVSPIAPKAAISCLIIALALFGALPLLTWVSGQNYINIADIFYRAGGLVFGGGHVVLPLLEAEMVKGGLVSEADFLSGYGATQAMPGPLFTFAAYLGTITAPAPNFGAALVALIAIFLPGLLLLIGVWPFWAKLQHVKAAQSILTGLNASVVGILGAALYDPIFLSAVTQPHHLVLALAGLLLIMKWQQPPLIVLGFLTLSSTLLALI